MKKNVGGIDRMFRFALGFSSLMFVFTFEEWFFKIVFGIVAVAGLMTSILGYCPISDKLGMNTAEKK